MNKLIWTFLLMKTGFASNCPKLVKLTLLEILGHSTLYGNFLNIFLQFAFPSICTISPRTLNLPKRQVYLHVKFYFPCFHFVTIVTWKHRLLPCYKSSREHSFIIICEDRWFERSLTLLTPRRVLSKCSITYWVEHEMNRDRCQHKCVASVAIRNTILNSCLE